MNKGICPCCGSHVAAVKLKPSEWFYTEYVVKGRSTTDIAAELDTVHAEVIRKLNLHGIPLRHGHGRTTLSAEWKANIGASNKAAHARKREFVDVTD